MCGTLKNSKIGKRAIANGACVLRLTVKLCGAEGSESGGSRGILCKELESAMRCRQSDAHKRIER